MASLTGALGRGLLAGLAAGLVFALFLSLVAGPMVGLSESLAGEDDHGTHGGEASHDADHGEAAAHHQGATGDHEGAVSGAVAETVSLVGAVAMGLLAGAALGAVHYFLEPALPGGADARSYLVGAAGFVTVSGAPWLALPPVPAGATESLPVETRIPLYAGLMVAGALACAGSLAAFRRVAARGRPRTAAVAAAVPLLALVGVATLAPTNAVSGVSGDLVAAYRGVVLVGQVLLWGVAATVHARLLDRRSRRSPDVAAEPYGVADD